MCFQSLARIVTCANLANGSEFHILGAQTEEALSP